MAGTYLVRLRVKDLNVVDGVNETVYHEAQWSDYAQQTIVVNTPVSQDGSNSGNENNTGSDGNTGGNTDGGGISGGDTLIPTIHRLLTGTGQQF